MIHQAARYPDSQTPRSGRTFAYYFILVLSLICALFVMVYALLPGTALSAIYKLYQWRSGVERKAVTLDDGYEIPYIRGGQGPVLVLIHGFGDSSISFVQAAAHLTGRYDVIMPTVPGFGRSKRVRNRSYGIRAQVHSMHAFFGKLGLLKKKFYLGGNSMGGHISAAYTLRYPGQVKKLILINAAGLKIDDPRPYKPNKAPLRTNADFERRLEKTFVKKPWVPAPFRKRFIRQSQANHAWLNRVRYQIRTQPDYILNARARQIRVPTLILWGAQDTIVRVVHARAWKQRIGHAQLKILDPMGHAPQYEDPARTARIIAAFLETRKP